MTPLEIGALVSALCLTALAAMLFLYWRAPLGYEDSDGWHPGLPENTHSPKIDE